MSRPRSARQVVPLLAVVGSVLGGLWSLVVVGLVVRTARITYYLPPPIEGGEATRHETWNSPVLTLVPVAAGAALLAFAGLVIGVLGLVRRGGSHLAVLLLPGASLAFATLALVLAGSVEVPVF